MFFRQGIHDRHNTAYEIGEALQEQDFVNGMTGRLDIRSIGVWSDGGVQNPRGIVFTPDKLKESLAPQSR